MTDEENSETNKRLSSISKVLFAIGCLGVIFADFLPLPEGMSSIVRIASVIALLVLPVMFSIKPLMREYKMQRRWDAEIAAISKANRKGKPAKKKEFPTSSYILSVLFVVSGLALIFIVPYGYQSYRIQSQAPNWPHTTGIIVSSEIMDNGSYEPMYQPRVITKYSVGGREYVTHDIYFKQSELWSSDNQYAYQKTDKYDPGEEVRVYYKPDEPSIAILDTGIRTFTYTLLAVGAVLTIFGTYGFYFSIRETYFFVIELFKKNKLKKNKLKN